MAYLEGEGVGVAYLEGEGVGVAYLEGEGVGLAYLEGEGVGGGGQGRVDLLPVLQLPDLRSVESTGPATCALPALCGQHRLSDWDSNMQGVQLNTCGST